MPVTSGVGSRPSGVEPHLPIDIGHDSIKVLVVDDHALLRAGTRRILDEAGHFHVVGEAENAMSAITMASELSPDIALVDISLPDLNGIELARHLVSACEELRVVVLTAYDDDDYVREALAAGVSGYLLKTMPAGDFVAALRQVHAGATVFDPSLPTTGAHPSGQPDPAQYATLTWREHEVMDLVAAGLANKAIALRLSISPRTVEAHLNRIFSKLGVSSRTELIRLAIEQGLVQLGGAPTALPAHDVITGPKL